MRPLKIKEQKPLAPDRHPKSENEYKGILVKWIGIVVSCFLLVIGAILFLFAQKIANDLSGADLLACLKEGAFWMSGVVGGVSFTLIGQKTIKIFFKGK